ncbi:HLA class II histocompatibility antigen, DRB1-16 beta chain-like, partial [Python bivittatus]|uniref:HLA class II histocompatibility antigen, DRB1-16 beta chain-like n=1 Tax=Python bivittatus TaxID=176946 RepID=A0A9F5J5P5_PYTBI
MGSAGVPLLLLLVGALSRIPGSEGGQEPPAHFLYQWKAECHFFNGTQRVRLLDRYFYDQQEFVCFDSDIGKYVAVTEFGQKDADYWNSLQDSLQDRRAAVDYFCRCHYGAYTFGQKDADYWNSLQDYLQDRRAAVDYFCRCHYGAYTYQAEKTRRLIGRRTKPTVTISPTKTDPGSPNTILLCAATGFYPVEIDAQWLKNG